jgi:hypothetical protein
MEDVLQRGTSGPTNLDFSIVNSVFILHKHACENRAIVRCV